MKTKVITENKDDDFFDQIQSAKRIDPMKDRSIVTDHHDDRRWAEMCHQEVQRLKRKSNYTVVTEFDCGPGARRRRKQ